ncbi:hypothetical protein AEST_30310 [Alishewanella aestuarii B11]|uniref:Uncharacterized protein n=1 Tax=Alishewanella aestuarii B11 TaxID=1197174 RepID=J2IAR6_9ALTE|nr:hypothetical protein AEST_30310 [Alishewanella aestuarii B11]
MPSFNFFYAVVFIWFFIFLQVKGFSCVKNADSESCQH